MTDIYQQTPEVAAFIAEIEAVCRKHGMSISHEDGHGAFKIETLNDFCIEWLRAAIDARGKKA